MPRRAGIRLGLEELRLMIYHSIRHHRKYTDHSDYEECKTVVEPALWEALDTVKGLNDFEPICHKFFNRDLDTWIDEEIEAIENGQREVPPPYSIVVLDD